MSDEGLIFVDVGDRPALVEAMNKLVASNLPSYMMWASPGNWRWHRIFDLYPRHQVAALDPDGKMVACVNSVPVAWGSKADPLPNGYDHVLATTTDAAPIDTPRSVCLLSVSVHPRVQGRGVARALILEIKRRSQQLRQVAVIAPLRPTRKSEYPLVPLSEYVTWKDRNGEPFDPWLRTHLALGAEVLGIAPCSFVVSQPVARWEQFTGRPWPAHGSYLVPGAIVPLSRDDRGRGVYAEPNVWVCHWNRSPDPALEEISH